MNCPNCGAAIVAGSSTCRKCGGAVEQPATAVSSQPAAAPPVQVVIQVPGAGVLVPEPVGVPVKSRIAAGVLGILLGFLGIHRFYLGYTGIGLVQLLITVCTCGYGGIATGIWGLIEGILILTGTIDRDAQGRLLRG